VGVFFFLFWVLVRTFFYKKKVPKAKKLGSASPPVLGGGGGGVIGAYGPKSKTPGNGPILAVSNTRRRNFSPVRTQYFNEKNSRVHLKLFIRQNNTSVNGHPHIGPFRSSGPNFPVA